MTEEEFEDFGLNFDYSENMEAMKRLEDEHREYSRSIKYNKDWHLSEDSWFTILNYLPLLEFNTFSQVCLAFVEILSFDERYLFFKKLSIDYPNLFDKRVIARDCHSIACMISDRLMGSTLGADLMINEYMLLIFKKGLFSVGIFNYIQDCDYLTGESFLRMFAKEFVDKGLQDLDNVPKRLLDDKEFVMKVMRMSKRSPYCYTHISERLKVDPEVVLTAVRRCPHVAMKVPYARLDLDTKKKICSIILNPPKSALIDDYYSYLPKVPLFWIPFKDSCYDREELLDYFIRKLPDFSAFQSLIVEYELVLECIQLLFFKKRDYYGTFSLLSNLVISKDIDYDLFSIFSMDDYPELFTQQIEKLPCVGKGIFTLNELIPYCFGVASFYMESILEQSYTQKHFDFFRAHLKRKNVFIGLARKIMDGSIREKAIDLSMADTFLSEVLSNKRIVKKLLILQPSYFPHLLDEFKEDKELIDVALRYPNNIEALGETDENYLKLLDKSFNEGLKYIEKKVGNENLRNFISRLYFNVDENGKLIDLKESIMYKYPKIIVPIVKYFNRYYNIENIIGKDQMIDIVKLGDSHTLERMTIDKNLPYERDPSVRKEILLKVSHFFLETDEIDDETCYEVIVENPKLLTCSPVYSFIRFLSKHEYFFGKMILAKRPKLIKRLYTYSNLFSEEICDALGNEVPEIVSYLENLKKQPRKHYRYR